MWVHAGFGFKVKELKKLIDADFSTNNVIIILYSDPLY